MIKTVSTLLLSAALAIVATSGDIGATTRRSSAYDCVEAFNPATRSIRYDSTGAVNPIAGHAPWYCPSAARTTTTLSLSSARVYYNKQNTSTFFYCTATATNTAGSSFSGSTVFACGTPGGCTTGSSALGRGYLDFTGAELPPVTSNALQAGFACLVPGVVGTNVYTGIEGYYFSHANE